MNALPPPLPKPPKPLALALVLAFVPSMVVLLIVGLKLSNKQLAEACIPAALISIGCCVASSFMLFKRDTTVTLVAGVLLAMLNALITLGLGCAAFLGNLNVH